MTPKMQSNVFGADFFPVCSHLPSELVKAARSAKTTLEQSSFKQHQEYLCNLHDLEAASVFSDVSPEIE